MNMISRLSSRLHLFLLTSPPTPSATLFPYTTLFRSGWLGVALTGSDTASNILFGNLQKITSEQLGLSPILMGAANSSGDRKSTRLNSSHITISYAVFCFKKITIQP